EAVRGEGGAASASTGELRREKGTIRWGAEAATSAGAANGSLGAVAAVSARVGDPIPGDGDNDGLLTNAATSAATVADTITLSEPAAITIRGSVEGTTSASNNDPVYADAPRGGVSLSVELLSSTEWDCNADGCWPLRLGELSEEYGWTLGDEGELV